jgi:hypothetical protein
MDRGNEAINEKKLAASEINYIWVKLWKQKGESVAVRKTDKYLNETEKHD